jgi:hypothetical protein
MNIHAYTEMDYAPASYPGFVSLNKREDGSVWLSVRTRGAETPSEIQLDAGQLVSLSLSIDAFTFDTATSGN